MQAAGARPGVNLRALSRHIRWQGADLVDLSNSEQELDQRSGPPSAPICWSVRVGPNITLPPAKDVSRPAAGRSKSTFDGLSDLFVVGSVGPQQTEIAGQHHVPVRHGHVHRPGRGHSCQHTASRPRDRT